MIWKNMLVDFIGTLLVTLALWFLLDAIVTYLSGTRGFSMFFTVDSAVGHVNKPNFSGKFGGFLDSFSARVSIGPLGERKSSKGNCINAPLFLFVGDSTTVGFEVDDDETFVSKINRACETSHMVGANFGVRAYDTHQVIANYKRISRKIKHDAVLYLITYNDLSENMQQFPYMNFAKHYGRVFHEKYYRPPVSNLEHAYLALRKFVSDHFYITTKGIELFEKWRISQSRRTQPYTAIPTDQAGTLIKLLNKLSVAVKSNGAKLYVAAYPCVGDICAGPDIERLLRNASNHSQEFTLLPLATELEEKFEKGEIGRERMRFSNDQHLSKFGHETMAKELARLIAENQ